jgi:hypothetical protein
LPSQRSKRSLLFTTLRRLNPGSDGHALYRTVRL